MSSITTLALSASRGETVEPEPRYRVPNRLQASSREYLPADSPRSRGVEASPSGRHAAVVTGKNTNHFPHLPPYTPPSKGLVARLPSSWIPYAQLMRLDRPAGFYAYIIPYLTGLLYAACILPQAPRPWTVLQFAAVLIPFNILLRGITCTWNDNVDQGFDRQVERCRHRPIARGAVLTWQANVFTLIQILVAYPLFTGFFPSRCNTHTIFLLVLFTIYSLLKRVSYYPQVFLGFPFAWGIIFSMVALGVDPLSSYIRPTSALFGANVLWTTLYDTIYAHQDIEYDEQAGVKSMSLLFRDRTKQLGAILAIGQVSLLAICGLDAGLGLPYFTFTVGGVAASLACYIYCVDLKRPESCGAWFYRQFLLVGFASLSGLLAEYWFRL